MSISFRHPGLGRTSDRAAGGSLLHGMECRLCCCSLSRCRPGIVGSEFEDVWGEMGSEGVGGCDCEKLAEKIKISGMAESTAKATQLEISHTAILIYLRE